MSEQPPPSDLPPERLPAPGPMHMRASDADRERYVAALRDAYAEGRIAADEYEERMDAAYRARTYADLVPLVHDLPLPAGTLPAAGTPVAPTSSAVAVVPGGAWGIEVAGPGTPSPSAAPAVAVFGGAERKGRWVVPETTSAVAVFGGVELDLSSAVLAAPRVEITAVAVFGGVEITVPHGVTVELEGFAIFGGREGPKETVLPVDGGPVVRVNGFALFGGVEVRRPKTPPQPPGGHPPAVTPS